jgi:hypothetical protein
MPPEHERHARPVTTVSSPGCVDASSAPRPATGQGLHVRPPRPAGAQLARRSLRGVRRAGVLGGREQLREHDEQDHLPRPLGVRARPATRAEGEDEQGDVAPHRTQD